MQKAQLLSVATALPPHVVTQGEVAQAAAAGFGPNYGDFARLARVFETSGIDTRHLVRPVDWYLAHAGWEARNDAYLSAGSDLLEQAARLALDRAGLGGAAVDVVVTVSSTGIATPGLEARIAPPLGLRADVLRVPVFGLGCGGGAAGLALAATLAEARPGALVLLLVVETCSLAFRLDVLTKANIVATALFGDGAAACLLRVGGKGLAEVAFSGQHSWPDTLDIMGWRVEDQGLGVIFDRAIPPFADTMLAPALAGILSRAGTDLGAFDGFACHPGGAKVITALECALGLAEGRLQAERAVLAACGNMSAPTVLFVLERVLAEGVAERPLVLALGPGFSAHAVGLRR